MRRPLGSSLGLVSLLALGSLGCRTPSSKLPLEQLTADQPAPPAQGETRETVAPLPVERPTDLLPPEVPVLVEAIDPAAVLGLFRPLDNIPEVATMRAELRGQLGGDPFDPDQWATLGLDSHGPAGLGVLDIASSGLFGYVSLIDQTRFEATIERFADLVGIREELATTEVGDARIHRLGRNVSIVVRGPIALLVFVDNPDRAARDHVVSAATLDPRESLGHSQDFVWARAQLLDADDGMLYVDPPALLEQIGVGREQEPNDYGVRYAQEELERARAARESAERIRELEARVEEERAWQRERELRDASERELSRLLLGTISTVVAGADLRDDGILAHARARISASNLLQRLFVAPERESPLLTALDHPPVFVVDGRLDVPVLLELAELLARLDGTSLTSVNTELQVELGIDVLGGLIPALSGEGGLAITQTKAPDPKRLGEVDEVLGLAAHVGLRDPDTVRRLIDALARDKRMGGALARAKRGDGWTLQVPDWRDVELVIVGDRLLLSTEPGFVRRVRDAEPGPLAAELAAPDHPLRGPSPAPVQRLYGRWSGLVLADAREPWAQEAEAYLYELDSHPSLTPEQAAKVPHGKPYKRKRAELDKAVAALVAFDRRRAQDQFTRNLRLAEAVGDVGFVLERHADGLGLTGRWRFAPGMTPVALGMQLYQAEVDTSWDEYDRLSRDVYQLADELRMLRRDELDAAAASMTP